MRIFSWWRLVLPAWLALCFLTGCGPVSESASDEQREPHFLNGMARLQTLDFQGAVEAFEKAIEVNPRNAAAHFELGLLFETRVTNYAAAVYHFERFVKLRNNPDQTAIASQHISACKQDLARMVFPNPSLQQALPAEMQRVARENEELKRRVMELEARLNERTAAVALGTVPGAPAPSATPPAAARPGTSAGGTAPPVAPAPPRAARTYEVKAGDTPSSIARKFNVKLDALLAANRSLDPRRMKPGQVLTIPSP